MKKILFVGRTTIDLIYLVDHIPSSNSKIKGSKFIQCAGGPACNASVVASKLGSNSIFYTNIGCSPLTEIVKKDLKINKINFHDFAPKDEQLATSSILIEKSNGNRTVVGSPIVENLVENFPKKCEKVDFVLWDGYYPKIIDYVCSTLH